MDTLLALSPVHWTYSARSLVTFFALSGTTFPLLQVFAIAGVESITGHVHAGCIISATIEEGFFHLHHLRSSIFTIPSSSDGRTVGGYRRPSLRFESALMVASVKTRTTCLFSEMVIAPANAGVGPAPQLAVNKNIPFACAARVAVDGFAARRYHATR